MRILHVITTFGLGGAESALRAVAGEMRSLEIDSHVVVMAASEDEPPESAIPVTYLGQTRGRLPAAASFRRLRHVVRLFKPDVVQGWMYHGNVTASLAAWMARVPVAWNIRHSLYDIRAEVPLTRQVIRLNKWLSRRASVVVNNSKVSIRQHTAFGFCGTNQLFIPNGFDCARFAPVADAKKSLCDELQLAYETPLIGMIARWHPMKDHSNLIRAAAQVISNAPATNLVLVGPGVEASNSDLVQLLELNSIRSKSHLLGPRGDTPRLHSAFDIGVLSSSSEGFPNVVGESMACATPCVVTDVGEAGFVVGDTGTVVPPRDSLALATGIIGLLNRNDRVEVGRLARHRIKRHFSIETVAARYYDVYHGLTNQGHSSAG